MTVCGAKHSGLLAGLTYSGYVKVKVNMSHEIGESKYVDGRYACETNLQTTEAGSRCRSKSLIKFKTSGKY